MFDIIEKKIFLKNHARTQTQNKAIGAPEPALVQTGQFEVGRACVRGGPGLRSSNGSNAGIQTPLTPQATDPKTSEFTRDAVSRGKFPGVSIRRAPGGRRANVEDDRLGIPSARAGPGRRAWTETRGLKRAALCPCRPQPGLVLHHPSGHPARKGVSPRTRHIHRREPTPPATIAQVPGREKTCPSYRV